MIHNVDLAPYGARPPDRFTLAVMAFTRNLPANWLGLRISMPFRRLAIDRLSNRPIDTTVWNARVRLYPAHNICEKNALFTPQIFDKLERNVLAAAVERRVAEGGIFTFVDIGANVGLYSLFVASRGGRQARVLAAEPQPGIVDRLLFNVRANPGFNIAVVPVAVTDRNGEVELVITSDAGGAHLTASGPVRGTKTIHVPCRPLAAIVAEAGVSMIDALKIDIEGSEHLALAPFLYEAPADLLPRLALIEDRATDWPISLYALLEQRGYVRVAHSRYNSIFRLT